MHFIFKINQLILILLLANAITFPQECYKALRDYINKKTYFTSYMYNRVLNKSIANKEHPINMPNPLPDATEVAQRMRTALERQEQDAHFLWGASTGEHQCSMQCTEQVCSYSRYAQQQNFPQPKDSMSMDMWNHYKTYIDYAHDVMGLNALRVSVEWALVQPKGPELWDQQALDHYTDMITYLIKKDVTPIICLHHYTDPCWYIDRGGFEKEENSNYFVDYCSKIYQAVTKELIKQGIKVKYPPLWATYVSPEGYAFKGYHLMDNPPANPAKKGLPWVAVVLKNMCEAQVQIHSSIHNAFLQLSVDQRQMVKDPKVGFLKNIHQLDPAKKTWKHYAVSPISSLVCAVGDMLQNDCIFRFFTTGKFHIHLPMYLNMYHENPKAKHALDFIGLNYYSNTYMEMSKKLVEQNTEIKTDNKNYHMYPEGLYRAVVELCEKLAKPLGIKIYVTENGIATLDHAKRTRFYQSYMYALMRAVEDGYPVAGYSTWTLADNYEWPSHINTERRFYGLCSVDQSDPSGLAVKQGSQWYVNLVKAYQK